jgi:arylsulfatase A-like enzyme
MMGDQALEYLDIAAGQEKPFCLAFSFKAPHVYDPDKTFMFQYDPALKDLYQDVTVPEPKLSDPDFFAALPSFLRVSENRTRWQQRFSTPEKLQKNVKDYWRLVSGVDVQVGRIRAHLKELGLDRNTIMVYSSDHGFYLGERGFAGKWYAHELSIRVPLLVYDPRNPGGGARRDEVALSIDIAPTILDLAGVDVPQSMQGHSLRPVLDGNTPDDWQTEFFYEHNLNIKTIPKSEGVRTPNWKYAVYHEATPVYEELYDLTSDPDEATNLVGSAEHQPILREMRRKHAMWKQRVR